MTSVVEWDRKFRLVRVHDEHREELGRLGLAGIGAAAVVVGGVALAGGSGNMLQAFYGVLVLGLLSNALNMAGVSSFLQVLVVGFVILLAVIIDRLRTRAAAT